MRPSSVVDRATKWDKVESMGNICASHGECRNGSRVQQRKSADASGVLFARSSRYEDAQGEL